MTAAQIKSIWRAALLCEGLGFDRICMMSGQPCSRMPDDGRVLTPEVAVFGDQVTEALARTLGTDLVGVYFVGSVALGGYVPGESDVDIAAVSSARTYRSAETIGGVGRR